MQKATGLTPIELNIQNTAPDLFKKFAGLNKAEQAKSVVEDVTKVVDNIEEAIKTQQ